MDSNVFIFTAECRVALVTARILHSSLSSTGSSSPVTLSQSEVVGSSVAVITTTKQPSPEFLATVVQAVKQALAAEHVQASVLSIVLGLLVWLLVLSTCP